MNTFPTTTEQAKKPSSSDESKPGFRTKTISMRLTPDEVAEVESAAERADKQPSEWLRETALGAARERPADPIELLLAEVWAVRHSLLNLFYAGAQATVEARPLLPESVLKIRDGADAKKLEQARQMLADFLSKRSEEGGEER
jgi:Mobilization protein NikA